MVSNLICEYFMDIIVCMQQWIWQWSKTFQQLLVDRDGEGRNRNKITSETSDRVTSNIQWTFTKLPFNDLE